MYLYVYGEGDGERVQGGGIILPVGWGCYFYRKVTKLFRASPKNPPRDDLGSKGSYCAFDELITVRTLLHLTLPPWNPQFLPLLSFQSIPARVGADN